MILKQTLKNHLATLQFTITTNILHVIMGYIFFDFVPDFWLVFILANILFSVPALILYIEYLLVSSGVEIEIGTEKISIRKKGHVQSFSTSELSKITVYKSVNMDKWGIPLAAFEYYYYARIETNLGSEIIITCLMSRQVEKEVRKLRGVPYTRKKRAFCTLSWK